MSIRNRILYRACPADRQRCLEAGIDSHLSKPIKMRQLAERLQYALQAKA